MDWLHLGETIALALSGGYHVLQKKRAAWAKEAAEEAAKVAAAVAVQEIEAASIRIEKLLAQHVGTHSKGMALLTELANEREAAIVRGKELAVEAYRKKLAEGRQKPPPTPPSAVP